MNTKKYITLDQALEVLDRQSCYWAAEYMKLIPAADVREVVKAEFVRCGDGKGVPYMCSHCGRTTPANMVEIWSVNFCPNCGADMREEQT